MMKLSTTMSVKTMSVHTTVETQEMPKVALIVGASGLVGQHLLEQLLESNHYSEVIALVRQHLPIEHHKLNQLQVDFDNLEAALNNLTQSSTEQECSTSNHAGLPKVDHIFCTLGSTIKKAGSKSTFRKIDYLYPLLIAKHFYCQDTALFAIVTAMSANKSSSVFYHQVKGEVELALSDIGFKHLGLFRPSMLSGARNEFRIGEKVGTILMNALAFLIPKKYQVIQAEKVAKAMRVYAELPPLGISIILSDQLQNY